MNNMVYAYIDESGNTAKNITNRFLNIAALVTDDPISIQRNIKIAERKIRKITKETQEIKAYRQSLRTRKLFLDQIKNSHFDIYSVAFDLSSIRNIPYNIETIYSFGISLLCKNIAYDYNNISFVLDQRYTSEYQRNNLNNEILQMITELGNNSNYINIYHQNSTEINLLRSIDFIAYEIYQKFKNTSNCYEIIENHIQNNIYFSNISWAKIKKESKTPQIDHPEL